MVIATAALGLVIGLVIGGLGGGGGALTVPALVYLLGLTAQDATTSSVLIVGISSLAGVRPGSGTAACAGAPGSPSPSSACRPPTWAAC